MRRRTAMGEGGVRVRSGTAGVHQSPREDRCARNGHSFGLECGADFPGWNSGRTGSGGENSNEFVGGGHEVRRCLEHLFGAFLFPEL